MSGLYAIATYIVERKFLFKKYTELMYRNSYRKNWILYNYFYEKLAVMKNESFSFDI